MHANNFDFHVRNKGKSDIDIKFIHMDKAIKIHALSEEREPRRIIFKVCISNFYASFHIHIQYLYSIFVGKI